MCLSVYLGANTPVAIPDISPIGTLGLELASWRPPTLKGYKHVYFLGQKNDGKQLGCSCLLWEQIGWRESGAPLESDDTYPVGVECPFKKLKRYVKIALNDATSCAIVCDDSNGVNQECVETDYHHLFLTPRSIGALSLSTFYCSD